MNKNTLYCYDSMLAGTQDAIGKQYSALPMKEQCRSYENALILPAKIDNSEGYDHFIGGVVDNSGEFVEESSVPGFMGAKYTETPSPVESCKRAVYVGYFFDCYGHMIGDSLRWAWFLQSNAFKSFQKEEYELVYVSLSPLKKYQLDLLRLAGIHHARRITEVTTIEQLIVPTPSLTTQNEQNYWRAEFHDTIDYMIAEARKESSWNGPKKIYLSRGKWGRNNDFGEEQIEKILHKQGYAIVYPERLSISEQIVMWNTASDIVCTEGSISHNALFCRSDARVTLLRKTLHVNKYSLFINDMRNINVRYVDCSLSLYVPQEIWWSGPFFVYANEQFCNCFNISPVPLLNWSNFRSYCKAAQSYGMLAYRLCHIDETYANILECERNRIQQTIYDKIRVFPVLNKRAKGIAQTIMNIFVRL